DRRRGCRLSSGRKGIWFHCLSSYWLYVCQYFRTQSCSLPIDDPFEGDPKLLALDAKGYISYCGPFSIVSEHELIHHLKLCSFENWVGTDQHRYAQLNENTLTL